MVLSAIKRVDAAVWISQILFPLFCELIFILLLEANDNIFIGYVL